MCLPRPVRDMNWAACRPNRTSALIDAPPPKKHCPYTREEVRTAVSTLRVGRKGEARWRDTLQRNVDQVFSILEKILAVGRSPSDAERKSLSKLIREASSFSQNHLRPLFMSSGFVKLHSKRQEDRAWVVRLGPDDRGSRYEHVVPLDFTLDANSLASDPAAALRPSAKRGEADGVPAFLTPLGRILLTPVCYVSRHEDRRIHRLEHPNWTRPFARYLGPEVTRDAPDDPIEIYDATTGELLAGAADYTWDLYVAALRRTDSYRDGLEWVEGLDDYLKDKHGPTLQRIVGWSPRVSEGDRGRQGRYTAGEREELRALLASLINQPNAPRTLCGRLALHIPTNGERLTLAVLSPNQDCADGKRALAFRLLIGGDHGTRALYWNERDMCLDGRAWINQVVATAVFKNAKGEILPYTQGSAVTPNGWAFKVPLPRGSEGTMAEKVSAALPVLVRAIIDLYPTWAAAQGRQPI